MSRNAAVIPAESSVLCEGCGYTLDGLPDDGRCPECGLEIAQSTGADGRRVPDWEDPAAGGSKVARFVRTSMAVILHPKRFYRTFATRRDAGPALAFARVHWLLSSALFAAALTTHAWWYRLALGGAGFEFLPRSSILFAASVALIYLILWAITRLAAWLTALEARYWGYRLPLPVVRRAMYYHAPHYLPVAVVSLATVALNAYLTEHRVIGFEWATKYLFVLCAEVLIGAWYLFRTYWVGMKNTMYANR